MKRIIAVVSFAVLATPVLAAEVSAPFEQTQLDRTLPNVQERGDHASAGSSNASDYSIIAPAQ